MIVVALFAFLSGVITILSPCILPVLPIVLSGSVGGGRSRPLGVVVGFIVTFTVFTLTLSAIVSALGISADVLRIVAVVILAAFGLVMLVPKLRDAFEIAASRLANIGNRSSRPGRQVDESRRLAGFASGLAVGFSIGIVWTPCVGPIMASVISLAVTQQVDGGAVLITIAYTLGTSIPMLAVMIGGRALLNRVPGLTKRTASIQRVFGALMIVVAVAIGFGWDRTFQTAVLSWFPNYGAGLTAIEDSSAVRTALDERSGPSQASTISLDNPPRNGRLADYGEAPAIVTGGPWINTDGTSLTMDDLRGKVVLVDFWTYSCVNCVRTIPYLRAWYDAYKDQGLVILGVHTPEFDFEKSLTNVQKAARELGVTWPVVLDNDYKEWRAYGNRYWPAHFFIDAQGTVRYYSFGEGHYDVSESVIRKLLAEAGAAPKGRPVSAANPTFETNTPETYLGYARSTGYASQQARSNDSFADYTSPDTLANGQWSLAGRWKVTSDYVTPESNGTVGLGFNAKDVYLVIEPGSDPARISIRLDGAVPANTDDVTNGMLVADESRVYHLIELDSGGPHTLSLTVDGDARLFAFTFG